MALRKLLIHGLMYTALGLGANPVAWAADAPSEWVNFVQHDAPLDVTGNAFDDGGTAKTLDAFEGKVVLLNFWATWCAPCRAEMPSLSALQAELGGDAFEVVTIAAGHNPPAMIDGFMKRAGIDNLPYYRDPKMEFAGEFGVVGLPVSVILNAEGKEVARLSGEADWSTPESIAYFKSLLAGS